MRIRRREAPEVRRDKIAQAESIDVYEQIAAIWEVLEQVAPGSAGKDSNALAQKARSAFARMAQDGQAGRERSGENAKGK
jgi:hypothetical protein